MRTETLTVLTITLLFLTFSACIELPNQLEGPTTTVDVIHVIDGDTIEIEWPNGTQSKVRILGIDTPEVHTDVNTTEWEGIDNETWLRTCGHRASNFTERWITQTVNLTFDENEGKKGYHGRYLAYVELNNETDLGAELIKHGWARVYPYSDCLRKGQYQEYEDDAQAENEGVWSKN